MKRKLFIILLTMGLLPSLSSAQILKSTWIFNPQLSGFNLGSTHTDESGKKTFDLGIKAELGNFIANNLAVSVGVGGDFGWNKGYQDNSVNLSGNIRYYTLTTMFIGVNAGYTHTWYKPRGGTFHRNDYVFIGAELGYAIFIRQNISVDPAIYWKHSFTDKFNQYGFKVGFSTYF